ncbi:MAG: putative transporter component containing two sulfur transport domain [Candidatus Methanohalarchaeum thermophilum]|uniref:Transporter component containing two sulfur transport domain n=1 Tax=Methanohalarchaeum thermophilum TaxID=1903181 RepID=A0A1Q6DXF7_METT1|nr:MAG: putative transporter component containing two sulfur transport domain [Candidatus Methanohalarchaeum thermophilum]
MFGNLRGSKNRQLLTGVVIGVLFGFLLQKGGVTNYNVILNQLLLRDFTVIKIMFTAVVTGMIGIYLMKELGLIQLSPKPFYLKGIVLGGLIFGVGFALLGYCPGTAAGAIGTGSIHAFFGAIGMLIGTEIFSVVYPYIKNSLMKENYGSITIPELLDVRAWKIILFILIVFFFFLSFFKFV